MKTPQVKIGPAVVEFVILAYRAMRSVLLIGETGIGKSEILVQSAEALKVGCIVHDLSCIEATDLTGLPLLNANEKTMSYAPPEFLPRTGAGLLILEELNRAPEHVRVPCLQLLTARSINSYRLPDGWLAVAAMNPPNGEYRVDELDPALLARFSKIHVVADPVAWCEWARRHGVHEKVCAFVESTPKIFTVPDSNPRSWTAVSDIVTEFEARTYSKQTLLVHFHGLVGDELGHAFWNFYFASGHDTPPSPQQILKSYPRYAAKVRAWNSKGNTAVLESLCQQLFVHMQGADATQAAFKNLAARENLAKLHADLPAEFRSKLEQQLGAFLKELPRRKKGGTA